MHRNTRIAWIVIGALAVCGLLYFGYSHFIRPANGSRLSRTINLGDVFTIELEENPSTGYSWLVEYDQAMLQLVKDQPSASATPLVGAPNKHTWEFKAIARGRTSVKFSYARPWESKPPEQVVEYTIRIK